MVVSSVVIEAAGVEDWRDTSHESSSADSADAAHGEVHAGGDVFQEDEAEDGKFVSGGVEVEAQAVGGGPEFLVEVAEEFLGGESGIGAMIPKSGVGNVGRAFRFRV
jgi:hypothetical protein